MIETANSSINKRICVTRSNDTMDFLNIGPVFPRRVRSKCPAIMFAANRTARVPGRIIFLIVSIHTINGISTGGVPWGTRCANICWVLLNHPNIINLNHKGKAKDSVIDKWLELV